MHFSLKKNRINKAISFSDVLPEFLKEMNIQNEFSLESLKEMWPEISGKLVSIHSNPYKIEDGTLFIEADHSTYANDVIMLKEIILKNLNLLFLTNPVTKIRVNVKKNRYKKV